MKIIKENLVEENLDEVAHAILDGKIVVFPTDTVYGIGTNAYDEKACERIYEVKGRPKYKPLSILISDISMLKEMVHNISPVEQKLIDTFWPGPLTIKFKKNTGVLPDIISAGDDYVRVRLVDKGIVYKLIEKSGVPIVAPSANLSGSLTGTKIENIVNELDKRTDYILDYGDIESDTVSTIVGVEDEKIILIREGKITKEQLERIADVI